MKQGLIILFILIGIASFAQDTTRLNVDAHLYSYPTMYQALRVKGNFIGQQIYIDGQQGGPFTIQDSSGYSPDGGINISIPGTRLVLSRNTSPSSRVNVMWFGAKRGTITDTSDYTNDSAFAKAVRYCAANRNTIYIPWGKFYLHHLLLPATNIYEDAGDFDGLYAMQNVRDSAFLNMTSGHLSNISIIGLRMFGNPLNTHQHGFCMQANTKTGITGGGGLWNSNFTLCDFFNFTGAQLYFRANDSLGQDLVNQFLTFEKCRLVRPDNANPVANPSYCLYVRGQTGQIAAHSCEFDGKVANTSKGINIYFDGITYASNWVFDQCTIQNSEYGLWFEGTRGASLRSCWTENVSKAVTAMNFAQVSISDICQFRNSGHATDGSGYLLLNNNASTSLINPYIISSADYTAKYINPIKREEKGNFLTFSTNVAIRDSNSLGRITGNVDSSLTIGGMAEIRAVSAGLPICYFKNDQHPSMTHLTILAFQAPLLFKADTTSHGRSNFSLPSFYNDSLVVPQGGSVEFVKGDSIWLFVNSSPNVSLFAHKGATTLQTGIDNTATLHAGNSSVILLNSTDTLLKNIDSKLSYGDQMTIIGFGGTRDSTTAYTTIVGTGNIHLGNFGVNGSLQLRRYQTVTLMRNSLGTNEWMVTGAPVTQKSSSTTTGLTEYVTKNEIIWNSAYDSSKATNLGWVVTRTGVTGAFPAWAATTSYQSSVQVAFNNNVYKSIGSGTSGTVAPTHTSGTATDGTVTWLYTGKTATFQPFYASVAPVDNAVKIDSMRRVGLNVQMLKGTTWTTVYTDSIAAGGGGGGSNAAQVMMVLLGGTSVAASTTSFAFPGIGSFSTDSTIRAGTFPIAGTIANLVVTNNSVQSSTGSIVFTFREGATIAGATAQPVTITIPANGATTSYTDLTHSFHVAALDKVLIDAKNNASATGAAIRSISFTFTPD